MSTLETQMPGRRVAARNGDRRKKLILAGLLVLLAVLVAIQLPKLLKGSDSAPSTASPPVATPATGAATTTGVATTTGGQPIASAATSTAAKRVRAIERMKPSDPFVPAIRERAPESGHSSAPRHAAAPSSGSTSAQPTSPTVLPADSTPTSPAAGGTGVVTPAEPTAAVIWTNGKRQVVGSAQTFDVGDATFKLVAVNRRSMRLQAADGSFTGGQRTITIRKGRSLILENKATGVRYTLRFAGATTQAATAPTGPMQPSIPEAPASPFESLPLGNNASNGS
jgi:hypothetical protein